MQLIRVLSPVVLLLLLCNEIRSIVESIGHGKLVQTRQVGFDFLDSVGLPLGLLQSLKCTSGWFEFGIEGLAELSVVESRLV